MEEHRMCLSGAKVDGHGVVLQFTLCNGREDVIALKLFPLGVVGGERKRLRQGGGVTIVVPVKVTAVQKESRGRSRRDVDESLWVEGSRNGVGRHLMQTCEQGETDHLANLMQHETLAPDANADPLCGVVGQLDGLQVTGAMHYKTAGVIGGRKAMMLADCEVVKVMGALVVTEGTVKGVDGGTVKSGLRQEILVPAVAAAGAG